MKIRHPFAVVAALLLVLPISARAQGGINLSWDDCGSFGQELKTFACNTNTGNDVLYVSAAAPFDMPQLDGAELEVRFFFTGTTISPWWHLETGGCRAAGVSSRFDFTAGPSSCYDVWQGQAAGGLQWLSGFGSPNVAQLRAVAAIPGTTAVTAGTEMYVFAFVFNHTKTVGTGSCAGCSSDAACIVLNSVKLVQPTGVGDYFVTNPLSRQSASWKCHSTFNVGGLFEGPPGCQSNCPVPALEPSWGTIKSMYR
jgi:hypothetical protein